MTRFAIVLALVVLFSVSSDALALPGPAPDGEAIARYDPATGQIVVSVTNILNWYVEKIGDQVMTGDTPLSLPLGGGFVSDSDYRIGEGNLIPFSYANANLGNVAQTGLVDDGSLRIFWNPGLSVSAESHSVFFATGSSNVPPTASINGPFVVDLLNDPLNISLDASGSTDDGNISTLTYRWDLDNDNVFEVDTGTTATLDIADVTTTFGGHGIYPVDVEVFDGEFWGIASTTVRLTSRPIVPASAQYNPETGQIVVSVDGVTSWYIESSSLSLTGDEPAGLPAAGGVVFYSDLRIGETTTTELLGYTVDLGKVAESNLPPGDLEIFWIEGFGAELQSLPVIYGSIPEPTSLALAVLGLFWLVRGRRPIVG